MTIEEAIAYLLGWSKMNRHEVYGSADDFINADRLESELRTVLNLVKD